MPLYEYQCKNKVCGHKFEKRSAIAESSKAMVCPMCGSKAEKIWSVPAEPIIEGGTPKFHK